MPLFGYFLRGLKPKLCLLNPVTRVLRWGQRYGLALPPWPAPTFMLVHVTV